MLKALVRLLVLWMVAVAGMAAAIPVIAVPKLTAYLLKPLLPLSARLVNPTRPAARRRSDHTVAFYLLTAKGLSVALSLAAPGHVRNVAV